jgi:hypothetical protein
VSKLKRKITNEDIAAEVMDTSGTTMEEHAPPVNRISARSKIFGSSKDVLFPQNSCIFCNKGRRRSSGLIPTSFNPIPSYCQRSSLLQLGLLSGSRVRNSAGCGLLLVFAVTLMVRVP